MIFTSLKLYLYISFEYSFQSIIILSSGIRVSYLSIFSFKYCISLAYSSHLLYRSVSLFFDDLSVNSVLTSIFYNYLCKLSSTLTINYCVFNFYIFLSFYYYGEWLWDTTTFSLMLWGVLYTFNLSFSSLVSLPPSIDSLWLN